ncbi:thioesterase-like superfamily-domain-containing protein [Xylariales sp. AK1849]|nr:thioesterase-like superfamily-domain-containing protein [Xylariales sp. AK1849]
MPDLDLASVESLTAVVPLGDSTPDAYTNKNQPWTPAQGIRGIFGGFLVAHSVAAAKETVPAAFDVYSLQSAFLKPGNAREQIVYGVERIADGRTFVTRLVKATQGDVCVYVATIGFQKNDHSIPSTVGGGGGGGSVLTYGVAMPDLKRARPEDGGLSTKPEILREMGFPEEMIALSPPDPFEWRYLRREKTDDPSKFRLRSFVRLARLEATTPAAHAAALAFLTDAWLIGTANLASPDKFVKGFESIAISTTINHSVWFHDAAARADEWMVCERETSWGADGRVLIHQRLWGWGHGRLVLSCTQEGTLRLKGANL